MLVARVFGTGEQDIDRNRDAFANLVAFLNGSIYYNLNNWYRIFDVIPGFDRFVRAFEEGVGLGGTPPELVEERRRRAASASRTRRILAWVRIVWNLLALPALMRAFDNVYIETSTLLATGALKLAVDTVGSERILYGSGAPARPMASGLGVLQRAGITEAQQADVLGGNARKLFGM